MTCIYLINIVMISQKILCNGIKEMFCLTVSGFKKNCSIVMYGEGWNTCQGKLSDQNKLYGNWCLFYC